MPMRKKDTNICALDVGTDNTTLLMARLYHNGKLEMLDSGFSHTRGLTKGIVVNLEEVAASIGHAVEEVESKTNISVGSVIAGISGNHIMSHNFSGAIEIKGKHAVIINRSNLVGKPLFFMLLKRNATVSICHTLTVNINNFIKKADILITAVGQPNFITKEKIKEGNQNIESR